MLETAQFMCLQFSFAIKSIDVLKENIWSMSFCVSFLFGCLYALIRLVGPTSFGEKASQVP